MTFSFDIPTPTGAMNFSLQPSESAYFVGANGGGKTRLAARIEEALGEKAHRIAAHRALTLNPDVPKVSEQSALKSLRYGHVSDEANPVRYRLGQRWGGAAAVRLLDDYTHLVQALFAEQANVAVDRLNNPGRRGPRPLTKFQRLVSIWNGLLPHRKLHTTGDDIRVTPTGASTSYSAREMSDGERAVFYLIGQTLLAAPDSLILFDEPELHVHRSILSPLWDELEAVRPDCAFVVISHDLDFVASREGQKFVLREYDPTAGWTIDPVASTGFSEEVSTLILGSRRPILFVEGTEDSLDQALYRACFPEWTIIPRRSCEEVLHAVATMRANASLTRVTCAGVVDGDDYSPTDIANLQRAGVGVLPVSEIENLFLLPDVIDAIAAPEGFAGSALIQKRQELLDELFVHASDSRNQLASVMRYCRRRIDRALKKIDLGGARDVTSLATTYSSATAAVDVNALASTATSAIQNAVANKDAAALLRWYDNKGAVLNIACKAKGMNKPSFEQWLQRALRNDAAPALTAAVRRFLPVVQPA